MKRIISSVILFLISVFAVGANDLRRGYRGFTEWNTDVAFYNEGYSSCEWHYGLSTTHGFQFNPHLFIGAGIWMECSESRSDDRGLSFPVFLQVRTDRTFGKFPLYADLRLGCTIFGRKMYNNEDSKLYISPTLGYRLDWGRKVCLNFGIGLTLRGCDSGMNHITWHPQPSIRIGMEF